VGGCGCILELHALKYASALEELSDFTSPQKQIHWRTTARLHAPGERGQSGSFPLQGAGNELLLPL